MKARVIADRLIIDQIVWLADSLYLGDRVRELDENVPPAKVAKVRRQLEKRAAEIRDRLVKQKHIVDGVPLPWEISSTG